MNPAKKGAVSRWGGVLIGAGALIAILTACGASGGVTVHEAQLAQHKGVSGLPGPPLLVVDEPFFSGDFESYEIYQKTYDMVAALTEAGVPVVAPWEYSGSGSAKVREMGRLVTAEGYAAEEVILVELRVVMLGGTNRVGVLGQSGETIVGVQAVQPGEVRIKVRGMGYDDELASLVMPFEEDGLSALVTASDRRPALGAALREAAMDLADTLGDHYPLRPREMGVATTFNPKPMFAYAALGDEPLEARFASMGAMEAIASKMRYYQYFDPDISVEHLMDFESRQGGLLVASIGSGALSESGLQIGDYIVSVDGRKALGPQVLARPLLTGRQEALALIVERSGGQVRIEVPARY